VSVAGARPDRRPSLRPRATIRGVRSSKHRTRSAMMCPAVPVSGRKNLVRTTS
jgi:hypothetical protein